MTTRRAITIPAETPAATFERLVRIQRWTVLGRDRSKFHWQRKFYHCLMGLLCFFAYAVVFDRTTSLVLLGVIGGTWVGLDFLRLYSPKVNQTALRLFGWLMRREELKSISGNSFFILGLFTLVLFFPKPIVLMSILFLAIGDPIAAVVGTKVGVTKITQKKSLEGAMANFAATSFVSFLMGLYYFQADPGRSLVLGIFGGMVSMIAELIPLPLDDNFTIPVLSAVLLSLGFYFFPLI